MRASLIAGLLVLVGAPALSDQVLSFDVEPGAIVCSGTAQNPARHGAARAGEDGRVALYFPTLASDRSIIERYQITVASPQGGAEVSVAREALASVTLPAIEPGRQTRCTDSALAFGEDLLSPEARLALRRMGMDGWPVQIQAPQGRVALSARLLQAADDNALTAGVLCPGDQSTCLTNAGVVAHQTCCDRYPQGLGCPEQSSRRICSAQYTHMVERYFSLYSWAGEDTRACAPSGTLIPGEDVSRCCGGRFRAMTEGEAVIALSAAERFNAPDDVDWAELFVCHPDGNRVVLDF